MGNHIVEFNGDGSVEIDPEQSLLDAALTAGIQHVHVCGGIAECSTCRVLVLEGAERLSAPNEREKRLNDLMHLAFDVIHIIRKLFSIFQKIIEDNGGRIIETMGDGFYAVFGCGSGRQGSVLGAVQSGLMILKEVDSLNETYFKPYFEEIIQVGMGVHIGKVISGEIRVGSIDRRFAMGLPVNIAARLQNATKELNNSFIVSAEAYDHLPEPLQTHTSTYVRLKGIANEVKVFLVGEAYK
jgi:adenylate cyclase